MREAMRNGDYTFRLPTHRLPSGERALQEALNDLGHEAARMNARSEVESWQKLTRVLTHEIMNATAPICSICQAYLAQPDIKESPYEEGIRAIQETSTALTDFVANYRKLTQLQQPVPEDVQILPLLETFRALYPQLNWHTHIPADLILHTDRQILHFVMVNIAKNALEAGATDMDIRWKDALILSNNGRPIPPEQARDIFTPFFTTKTGGNGIGLPLSRWLLALQNMDLHLETGTAVAGFNVTFSITN